MPEAPVMFLSICSPSTLLTLVFLPAESSLLQWSGRGYPQDQCHVLCQHQGLPGISRLHVCVLQCFGKYRFPSQVFQQKSGYQYVGTNTHKYLEIEIKPAQFSLDLKLLWMFNCQRKTSAYSQPLLNVSYWQVSNYLQLLTTSLDHPAEEMDIKMIEAGNTL